MEDFFTPIKLWLANPIVGKLIAVGIGILVINFIFRVLS